MKKFIILERALHYIEENLTEEISPERTAEACNCSLSTLQKLFATVFGIGVADYITRRRLTCAAQDLLKTNRNILDIAVEYRYQSHEVFTRAFAKLWGMPPSAFRTKWRFSGIFPGVEMNCQKGGFVVGRNFDISELYAHLCRQTGTYVLCFDVCGLSEINQIARKAGDLAILTCLKRIDENKDADMLLFRISGDEFVLLTNRRELMQARKVAEKVLEHNGESVDYAGHKIPVAMWAAGVKMDRSLQCDKLYVNLERIIDQAKECGERCWFAENT